MPSEQEQRRPYRGQRALDLVLLALAALPALVIGSICALAVRIDSRGPAIYRQQRVGRDGHLFTILKFRTMVVSPANPLHPDAARITRAGKVLRGLSLDELPQLVNVLRGDMSVVGPRPTLSYQVERYDARQRRRLVVRPGLTGLAQVHGRNALTWAARIEFDLDYVERQSFGLDLRIVCRTVPALLGRRGVTGHPSDDPIATPPEAG